MAGNFWYEAPSWKIHQFKTLGGGINSAGNGFLNNDYDVALDVDGDGWLDVVTGFIYEGLSWYRNPGTGTAPWVRTQIDGGEHHSGDLWDIDGDGKRLELRPIRVQEFGKNIAWPWVLSRALARFSPMKAAAA